MLMRRPGCWQSQLADASAGARAAAPAGSVDEVAPVLDAAALERLSELDPAGKNRLIERVLQAFETSTLRLVPQLHAAQQAGDLATVRHVAHTLKSSSASIGAIKLSQLCAEIEAMIRLESYDELPERIGRMDAESEPPPPACVRWIVTTSFGRVTPGTGLRHFARMSRPGVYSCVAGGWPSGAELTSRSFFGGPAAGAGPASRTAAANANRTRFMVLAPVGVEVEPSV